MSEPITIVNSCVNMKEFKFDYPLLKTERNGEIVWIEPSPLQKQAYRAEFMADRLLGVVNEMKKSISALEQKVKALEKMVEYDAAHE